MERGRRPFPTGFRRSARGPRAAPPRPVAAPAVMPTELTAAAVAPKPRETEKGEPREGRQVQVEGQAAGQVEDALLSRGEGGGELPLLTRLRHLPLN